MTDVMRTGVCMSFTNSIQLKRRQKSKEGLRPCVFIFCVLLGNHTGFGETPEYKGTELVFLSEKSHTRKETIHSPRPRNVIGK